MNAREVKMYRHIGLATALVISSTGKEKATEMIVIKKQVQRVSSLVEFRHFVVLFPSEKISRF